MLSACEETPTDSFEITLNSNREKGHQVRTGEDFTPDSTTHIKTVIVGGGAAGVSAYAYLEGKNVALIEMNNFLGGTAAGGNHKSTRFANGAHYDLIYPSNYGQKGLKLLKAANIISYDEYNDNYHFVDHQFLVDPKKEATCWRNGKRVDSPLDGFTELELFKNKLMPFADKMVMPTNQIHDSLWYLNAISFNDWLDKEGEFSKEFKSAVSYQMKDDWGGDISQVSALSGIHYYMCRPYYDEEVELLSPPEGNLYFIEKLLATTNYENIYLNNTCVKIEALPNEKWSVITYDSDKEICREFISDEVIYAGNKHALNYIAPEVLHQDVADYTAWISVNLILKTASKDGAYWQNDVIGMDENFMGYSNSYAQFDYTDDNQVLTAYYCFDAKDRQKLVDIEKDVHSFVDSTIYYIEKSSNSRIQQRIEHVNVNFLGHAMPLPAVGYLNKSYNQNRNYQSFTFAGVDTGRLPLFFEALESGIQAVDAFQNDTILRQL